MGNLMKEIKGREEHARRINGTNKGQWKNKQWMKITDRVAMRVCNMM